MASVGAYPRVARTEIWNFRDYGCAVTIPFCVILLLSWAWSTALKAKQESALTDKS